MLVMRTLDEAQRKGEDRNEGPTVQAVRRLLPEVFRDCVSVEAATRELFQWSPLRDEQYRGGEQVAIRGVLRGSLTQMEAVFNSVPRGHPAHGFARDMRILQKQWLRREACAEEGFGPHPTEELLRGFDSGGGQFFAGWNVQTDERIINGVVGHPKGSQDVRAGEHIRGEGFTHPSFLLREASTGATFEHPEWWMRMV